MMADLAAALTIPFLAGMAVFWLLGRIPGPLAAWHRGVVLAAAATPVGMVLLVWALGALGWLHWGISPAGGGPLIP